MTICVEKPIDETSVEVDQLLREMSKVHSLERERKISLIRYSLGVAAIFGLVILIQWELLNRAVVIWRSQAWYFSSHPAYKWSGYHRVAEWWGLSAATPNEKSYKAQPKS